MLGCFRPLDGNNGSAFVNCLFDFSFRIGFIEVWFIQSFCTGLLLCLLTCLLAYLLAWYAQWLVSWNKHGNMTEFHTTERSLRRNRFPAFFPSAVAPTCWTARPQQTVYASLFSLSLLLERRTGDGRNIGGHFVGQHLHVVLLRTLHSVSQSPPPSLQIDLQIGGHGHIRRSWKRQIIEHFARISRCLHPSVLPSLPAAKAAAE